MTKIALHVNGVDFSDFVESATLSSDTYKFNKQLDVNMTNTTDGRTRAFEFSEGDVLAFLVEGQKKFVGVIFEQGFNSNGAYSFKAYDSNIYLALSTDSRVFIRQKASDIISLLAKDFGVVLGTIADTGYVIPYLKCENMTLSNMIYKALKLTEKQVGKRFFVGNNNGKLTLTAGVTNQSFEIVDGSNLISATYTRSIEDTKTQVKVIGGAKGKETVVVVKDDEKRKKYGVLQAFEKMDEKATASQIKQRAQTLLTSQSQVEESMSVEAIGDITVDIGTPVYVENELTTMKGAYYVVSCTHKFANGVHIMTTGLSRTYELPDIEVSDDEITVPKPSQKKKKKKQEKKETKDKKEAKT